MHNTCGSLQPGKFSLKLEKKNSDLGKKKNLSLLYFHPCVGCSDLNLQSNRPEVVPSSVHASAGVFAAVEVEEKMQT